MWIFIRIGETSVFLNQSRKVLDKNIVDGFVMEVDVL
jgi:hypothetical protein